jgi:hypothetical protein
MVEELAEHPHAGVNGVTCGSTSTGHGARICAKHGLQIATNDCAGGERIRNANSKSGSRAWTPHPRTDQPLGNAMRDSEVLFAATEVGFGEFVHELY